ncbi:Alpha/Beta hydrolase protein [Apodospora peruviana]|uniref:Alpha/Beta hydrolase protein n=1 Tax=Apodospora peruviana TaxID=516989 RepID=A0AAE0IPK5_9PEZI|nr:Alpha/Beta hydrolase protein [Apodospora peruviana]
MLSHVMPFLGHHCNRHFPRSCCPELWLLLNMFDLQFTTILLLVSATAPLAVTGRPHAPRQEDLCKEVSFSLPVTSQNLVFSSPPPPDNGTAVANFIRDGWAGSPTSGTVTIKSTFTIRGTYCIPPSHIPAQDTLEILLHGITYNKTMWTGYGFASNRDPSSPLGTNYYNWHHHANTRGYATLAIDRLGHGANPDRPDPLSVVQPQIQVDLLQALLTSVRSSSCPAVNPLHTIYGKVVLVGHSWGSYLSVGLAKQFPTSPLVDALVLTGFSTTINASVLTASEFVPAALQDPERFPGHAYGYATMARAAKRLTYYGGEYDPAIPAFDFAYKDTVTAGEAGAFVAVLDGGSAVGFSKPVLVVTGAEDKVLCKFRDVTCAEILNKSRKWFPDVKGDAYEYLSVAETGHDLTLHYSAPETFEQVHDWLDKTLAT